MTDDQERIARRALVYRQRLNQFPGEFPFADRTECVERMQEEDISDPWAFCNAWCHESGPCGD